MTRDLSRAMEVVSGGKTENFTLFTLVISLLCICALTLAGFLLRFGFFWLISLCSCPQQRERRAKRREPGGQWPGPLHALLKLPPTTVCPAFGVRAGHCCLGVHGSLTWGSPLAVAWPPPFSGCHLKPVPRGHFSANLPPPRGKLSRGVGNTSHCPERTD